MDVIIQPTHKHLTSILRKGYSSHWIADGYSIKWFSVLRVPQTNFSIITSRHQNFPPCSRASHAVHNASVPS